MSFDHIQQGMILRALKYLGEEAESERLISMYRSDAWPRHMVEAPPPRDEIEVEPLIVDLLSDIGKDETAAEDLALIGFELLDYVGRNLDISRLLQLPGEDDRSQGAFSKNLARYIETPGRSRRHIGLPSIDRVEEVLPKFQDFLNLEIQATQSLLKTWRDIDKASGSRHSPMTVIVHGTNALRADWWKLGTGGRHTFADFVNTETNWPLETSYPGWSGGKWNRHREKGAKNLVTWLGTQSYTQLRIIAHSHGGNVAIRAGKDVTIDHLILLGTPITLEYIPNINNIKRVDSVYSFNDTWQLLGSRLLHRRGEGRSITDSADYTNHLANDNGSGRRPNHSALHEEQTWKSSDLLQLIQ